jgi:hypothetical protein
MPKKLKRLQTMGTRKESKRYSAPFNFSKSMNINKLISLKGSKYSIS